MLVEELPQRRGPPPPRGGPEPSSCRPPIYDCADAARCRGGTAWLRGAPLASGGRSKLGRQRAAGQAAHGCRARCGCALPAQCCPRGLELGGGRRNGLLGRRGGFWGAPPPSEKKAWSVAFLPSPAAEKRPKTSRLDVFQDADTSGAALTQHEEEEEDENEEEEEGGKVEERQPGREGWASDVCRRAASSGRLSVRRVRSSTSEGQTKKFKRAKAGLKSLPRVRR
ncbi:unnamed protein product [Prorocentrum cordatum]|uniref:Uncharacterized protein n=1 Tax=Prorocentrum cordatum TaxID=2364126 RepID=A0ABN9TG93_9DINO|nr:unnamed protein product [Polarella glacialis]